MTGTWYFLISFGGVYVLGFLTGQFAGKNGLGPMYGQVLDNINLAFLAPAGAALLCNLYNVIEDGVGRLSRESLVADDRVPELERIVARYDRVYNNAWVAAGALGFSLLINVYNYFHKTDSWLAIHGGVTGLYGRAFIVVNFAMIALILYKCAVTTFLIQDILGSKLDVRIEPMHPDGAGGLQHIGRLANAVNSFVLVVLIFLSLLVLFDPFTANVLAYKVVFWVVFLLSPFFLLLSLSKAHRKMSARKAEDLERLALTFQHHYAKLTRGGKGKPYEVEDANEIVAVHGLYEIVDKMPVWPFDTTSVRRFASLFLVPAALFLVNQLTSTDSLLYRVVRYLLKNFGVPVPEDI